MRPVSVAQAWAAPVLVTVAGAGFALYGAIHYPGSSVATACIVMLLAVPALSTALIARGLVGMYYGARWAGAGAVVCGVGFFVALVLAAMAYESPLDPARHSPGW